MPVGRGAERPVFGLVTTLPHSAAHAAVFCHSKTMADFLAAFTGTLHRLGGAPEAMVLDRDSSIVVPRSRPARLHREVAGLFGALRIRPAIGYLETSFLALRKFSSLADSKTSTPRRRS